jgi:uncharacterized protein YbcI
MAPGLMDSDFYNIEQEFIHLINGLMKKTMGKGSTNTEIYFVEKFIMVRATGVLTAQEKSIIEGEGDGVRLIKDYRSAALMAGKDYFASQIKESFDSITVEDIFFDMNVDKDTALFVFTLL